MKVRVPYISLHITPYSPFFHILRILRIPLPSVFHTLHNHNLPTIVPVTREPSLEWLQFQFEVRVLTDNRALYLLIGVVRIATRAFPTIAVYIAAQGIGAWVDGALNAFGHPVSLKQSMSMTSTNQSPRLA